MRMTTFSTWTSSGTTSSPCPPATRGTVHVPRGKYSICPPATRGTAHVPRGISSPCTPATRWSAHVPRGKSSLGSLPSGVLLVSPMVYLPPVLLMSSLGLYSTTNTSIGRVNRKTVRNYGTDSTYIPPPLGPYIFSFAVIEGNRMFYMIIPGSKTKLFQQQQCHSSYKSLKTTFLILKFGYCHSIGETG